MLFPLAKLLNIAYDRRKKGIGRQFAISKQRINQAVFAKLLFRSVERFGHAVRVQHEHVPGKQVAFRHHAIPFFKESEDGAGRIEAFQSTVAAKQEAGEVSTICVSQTPQVAVIFDEKKRRISTIGRILIEELVGRLQEASRADLKQWPTGRANWLVD